MAQQSDAIIGQYIEVEPGVELYVEDVGKGRPVIFIPGWTFTTRVFSHQFAHFSKSHRVISYDPRSHGRSSVTFSGNNYGTHAQDLKKLIDQLELENPVLVGWSAGSCTVWHYVRHYGTDNLAGFVNIDMPPIGTSPNPGDWIEAGFEDLAHFFQGVQTPAGLRGVVEWYADNVMIEQDMSPELTQWVVEQSLCTPPIIAANLITDIAFSNYVEEAVAIDNAIPSLHIAANHWSETAKAFINEKCPKSQFESFGGHMMYWEYPEKFNPILAAFLKNT